MLTKPITTGRGGGGGGGRINVFFLFVACLCLVKSKLSHSNIESLIHNILLLNFLSNGSFALTGHMVQNPPYWMVKECSRFEHKGIPTCQTWLSFVLDVPVEDATFFLPSGMADFYHVTN